MDEEEQKVAKDSFGMWSLEARTGKEKKYVSDSCKSNASQPPTAHHIQIADVGYNRLTRQACPLLPLSLLQIPSSHLFSSPPISGSPAGILLHRISDVQTWIPR